MGKKQASKTNDNSLGRAILRVLFFVFVVPILLIITIIGLVYVKYNIDAGIAKHDIGNYLEEKYGKQFVVENYRVEGAGLAVDGDPEVDAYPKSDPSIRFRVTDIGDYKEGRHSYWDSYPDRIWEEQIRVTIHDALKKSFDDNIKLKSLRLSSSLAINRSIRGEIPGYKEAFKKYGRGIYMTVRIRGGMEYGDLSGRLYSLINDLKSLGVSLAVGYRDKQHKAWLGKPRLDDISSADDIKKYIEEVRR